MTLAGIRQDTTMPEYLKQHLTWKEVQSKQAMAEEIDGRRYIVWKHGRTTHFTFGIANDIHSNYNSTTLGTEENPMLTNEWAIKNDPKGAFSLPGDSGSFVWDTDGYVVGQLWGGPDGSIFSYVTPIEHVLEDVRQACGATKVELVVRLQEMTSDNF
jgi:hypothetical protein